MSRMTPEYQRMMRARYKRNPKHAEVQAVLNLWASATEDEKWQVEAKQSARAAKRDSST